MMHGASRWWIRRRGFSEGCCHPPEMRTRQRIWDKLVRVKDLAAGRVPVHAQEVGPRLRAENVHEAGPHPTRVHIVLSCLESYTKLQRPLSRDAAHLPLLHPGGGVAQAGDDARLLVSLTSDFTHARLGSCACGADLDAILASVRAMRATSATSAAMSPLAVRVALSSAWRACASPSRVHFAIYALNSWRERHGRVCARSSAGNDFIPPHAGLRSATAVRVKWLGDVPVVPACGAQVVMRASACYFMSFWREAGQGAGGYNGGAALAFRGSAASLQIVAVRTGGGREGANPSGAGDVHAGGVEKGAAVRAVECEGGAGPQGDGAHKALPVRSPPDLVCFFTGAGGGL
ncbi:hypothetical protein B0H13DRAFT_2664033 [Mycena leptocephala]|nr:hypothetical protein B0H13DRAFT_2664033 [Mycena leptocephala]